MRRGEASPLWVDVQKLCNMCVLSLSWNFFVSHRSKPYKFPMHCSKCVSFWGTSYSRPPIDPYITPPLLQNPGGATASDLIRLVTAAVMPVPSFLQTSQPHDTAFPNVEEWLWRGCRCGYGVVWCGWCWDEGRHSSAAMRCKLAPGSTSAGKVTCV